MTVANRRQFSGFTLIEVMIAVGILGILVGIAVPTYQQYRVKTNRADAQAFLMDVAQRQQQYLMDARAYAGTLVELGTSAPSNVARNYTVTIAVAGGPPPTFTLTATPVATSGQASDGVMTLDQSGNKLRNGLPW